MMTPYYEQDGIILYNGDCLNVMQDIADESIDVTITSPPYNMRTRIRNGKYTEREKSEHFSKKYSGFHDALPINDYYLFHKKAINEIMRISAIAFINIQIVTGSKEAWFKLIGDFNKSIKDIIVWDKGEGQPAMHPAVINRSYELILILESVAKAGRAFDKYYFKRGEMPDIWRFGRGGIGEIKGHSALYPQELVMNTLSGWSREGEIILDPFCGTGTTLVAAKKMKRKAIGIEINPRYCEIAVERLRQEYLI